MNKRLIVINFEGATFSKVADYISERENRVADYCDMSLVAFDETPIGLASMTLELIPNSLLLGRGTTVDSAIEHCDFFGVKEILYSKFDDGAFDESKTLDKSTIDSLRTETTILIIEEIYDEDL